MNILRTLRQLVTMKRDIWARMGASQEAMAFVLLVIKVSIYTTTIILLFDTNEILILAVEFWVQFS